MSDSNLIKSNEPIPEVFNTSLPVTGDMLASLKNQRALLLEFVASQLRKEIDFGIVPGTNKPSLLKPGAEKIRGLFGLNIKLDCTSKELDRTNNFAMYTYKAQVYRGDNLIAECEGSTNSQEKKYKERTVYVYNQKTNKKEPIKEATPVCDILNTLQKMAQKRAFVGAIILAVGASDFFTQDIDELEDARNVGTAPRQEQGPSAIPSVINVSSNPTRNNQNVVNVEAVVSYEDRELAKESGFRYNAAIKKWTKEIRSDETTNFPFEVRELK